MGRLATLLGKLSVAQLVARLARDDPAFVDGDDEIERRPTEVLADGYAVFGDDCNLHLFSRCFVRSGACGLDQGCGSACGWTTNSPSGITPLRSAFVAAPPVVAIR
jgi:hypothetical protein